MTQAPGSQTRTRTEHRGRIARLGCQHEQRPHVQSCLFIKTFRSAEPGRRYVEKLKPIVPTNRIKQIDSSPRARSVPVESEGSVEDPDMFPTGASNDSDADPIENNPIEPEERNAAVAAYLSALARFSLEDEEQLGAHDDSESDNLGEEIEGVDNNAPPAAAPASQPTPAPADTAPYSKIRHVAIAQEFIDLIRNATLDNCGLDQEIIDRLRDPGGPPIETIDPKIRLSIDIYLGCKNASRETYNHIRRALSRCTPPIEILSYHLVEKSVANLTGIVEVEDEMCINSCLCYVGPYKALESCPKCDEPRWNMEELARTGNKRARQKCTTILLGPQIQALRRSSEMATAMTYLHNKVQGILASIEKGEPFVYDDLCTGSDFLELYQRANLGVHDTVVTFSIDGAQLQKDKKSDSVIGIFTCFSLEPSLRYKKDQMKPAILIPGPNKAKNIESFLFRTFQHISAIQKENDGQGLAIWSALTSQQEFSKTVVALGTADALALAEIDGRVGHTGARGCRNSCPLKGQHLGSGTYYPVHTVPHDPANLGPIDTSKDFDIRNKDMLQMCPDAERYNRGLQLVINSPTARDYKQNRLKTGISKPTIFSALDPRFTLPSPRCFTTDLMHLFGPNKGEVFVKLYRGTFKCANTDSKLTWKWATLMDDDLWEHHGEVVEGTTKHFPSSFHRPPRNIAAKANSGYKTTEWDHYLYGLGPGLLRTVLPEPYWQHHCLLVRGVRIMSQRQLTQDQLQDALSTFTTYIEEYERLYYQRRPDRVHFVRQSLHTLIHLPFEAERVGPGCYTTQFTLERAIGELGGDIRLYSDPFSNVRKIAVRLASRNALQAIYPMFAPDTVYPKGSIPLAQGFVLLRPRDRYRKTLQKLGPKVAQVLAGIKRFHRWGRLALPNGQIARSLFSEQKRTSPHIRISRNVKVHYQIFHFLSTF